MSRAPRLRKRIDTLPKAEARALRDAFRELIRSADPRANYTFWAGLHGQFCPHRCALFLPWHRAYLFAFEDALRATSGGSDVTLPYWDWTVLREIPELVKQEPLDAERHEHHDPDLLPTAEAIKWVLDEPKFKFFGGVGCAPGQPRAPGSLENEHGSVHMYVGPVMAATATAARDPLFWFHHAYVDRVWDQWQQRHQPSPACLDTPLDGIPGRWTVREVVDIRAGGLNYDYEAIRRVGTETIHIEPTWHRQKLSAPSQRVGGRLHIRLENVRIAGNGEPPDLIEVQFYADKTELKATIALFGLEDHAQPAPGTTPHEDQDHHGPKHFGAVLHPVGSTSAQGGLFLTPRWVQKTGGRASLDVGAILLIDE